MTLEAMILIGIKENGVLLLENIAEKLSAQRWMSTQTAAYSLIAVAKFTGGKTSAERISFDYSFSGGKLKSAETGMPLAQIELEAGDGLRGKLEFKNKTDGILFVRTINSGLPKPGQENAAESNLAVEVYYTDMEGSRLAPGNILQGTDFKAVYKVYNPGIKGY
jgi:hypothetical protein